MGSGRNLKAAPILGLSKGWSHNGYGISLGIGWMGEYVCVNHKLNVKVIEALDVAAGIAGVVAALTAAGVITAEFAIAPAVVAALIAVGGRTLKFVDTGKGACLYLTWIGVPIPWPNS